MGKWSTFAVVLVVACGTAAAGAEQSRGPAAPTDQALVIPAAELAARQRDMPTTRSNAIGLIEGGAEGDAPERGHEPFRVRFHHRLGTERPRIHAHLADLWIVQAGSATLVTGGTLVGATQSPGDAPGELVGTSIEGGVSRTVASGDTIYVPAGVAHRFVDADLKYLAIHFPTAQPH